MCQVLKVSRSGYYSWLNRGESEWSRANRLRLSEIRMINNRSNQTYGSPVAPNLLARQFTVDRANAVWVSDITYIWTSEGWLYLAGVVDLYSLDAGQAVIGRPQTARP